MSELAAALVETVALLRGSNDSAFSPITVAATIEILEGELLKLSQGGTPHASRLRSLYAPTGTIQETSIDNGWAEAFLRLAATIDKELARGRRP